MEFRFNVNEVFKQPIVEVGNTLIPPSFTGDKRALWDTQSKIAQIVNAIGEASAHAQGLTKPITTADRLRNSEHRLYLLIDQKANGGKGAVTGMLKTGEKGLYVFDRNGQHFQVSPPCVLDFYIHESRQRSGFGKQLFEHMLQREQIEPVKLAIDRPSNKFLGFLNKHYGLNTPVKQMNNYVVFDGFFPRAVESERAVVETEKSNKKQSANGLQQHFASPYGRYGAPRPPCSMGQIIHNDSAVIKRNQEPAGVKSEPFNHISMGQGTNYSCGIPMAWQSTPNIHFNQMPPNITMPFQNHSMAQGDVNVDMAPSLQNQPNFYNGQPNVNRHKEPLIPQAFDGTVRKIPHTTQSIPTQNYNPGINLHGSASVPANCYQPSFNATQRSYHANELPAQFQQQPPLNDPLSYASYNINQQIPQVIQQNMIPSNRIMESPQQVVYPLQNPAPTVPFQTNIPNLNLVPSGYQNINDNINVVSATPLAGPQNVTNYGVPNSGALPHHSEFPTSNPHGTNKDSNQQNYQNYNQTMSPNENNFPQTTNIQPVPTVPETNNSGYQDANQTMLPNQSNYPQTYPLIQQNQIPPVVSTNNSSQEYQRGQQAQPILSNSHIQSTDQKLERTVGHNVEQYQMPYQEVLPSQTTSFPQTYPLSVPNVPAMPNQNNLPQTRSHPNEVSSFGSVPLAQPSEPKGQTYQIPSQAMLPPEAQLSDAGQVTRQNQIDDRQKALSQPPKSLQPSSVHGTDDHGGSGQNHEQQAQEEIDLSKGYPPHNYQIPVATNSPIIIRN
ncbi:hypothetical protein ABEB36_001082 [Hypothenemus hampei]|uniref:Alpha-tubulin N-acetyltransferase n=1 Tax=Hypothenemus hampei TaxID=57062 RepID=A0ABD1FGP8_HYPHA